MTDSETIVGTFDALVAGLDPAQQDLARRLRALIREVHPEAVEVVRLGDHAASFGVGPKKMSEAHTYVMPQAGYVNLGFYHGVALPDPDRLLQGTGKRLRHVKVYSHEDLAAPALRRLIAAAVHERTEALAP